jgi:acid phosphatase
MGWTALAVCRLLVSRKHVPFLSFANVHKDPKRCANVVDASAFEKDLAANRLPDYSLYIPNQRDDGHRGGIREAGDWFAGRFGPLIAANRLPDDLLLIVTCDEDEGREGADNRVMAILHGRMVVPGRRIDRRYTHYGLLRTIEEGLGLGTLGREDATATVIQDVWATHPE